MSTAAHRRSPERGARRGRIRSARPWLWLYRPVAPSSRAQTIQVVHMAHAMAARGHRVTLAVDPARPGVDAADVLAWYDLAPLSGLDLRVLPVGRTAASFAFRALVGWWLLRHGREGVVYARSKRYARSVLRSRRGVRVVLEAHEVDSAQAAERGADPGPLRALEREVLRGAAGVVTNAPGTLEVLALHHVLPPAVALPNGCAGRANKGAGGQGVGYVGSVRPWKDLPTLAAAATLLDCPVTLVGVDPESEDAQALVRASGARLAVRPPVPYREVAEVLGGFDALVLPLGRGLLPERLTSPLKLYDYLASGVPVVAADVPTLRQAAGDTVSYYRPGDADHLAACLVKALERPRRVPDNVRTWAHRAAEVEAFVSGLP